jgi:hypothetical protein
MQPGVKGEELAIIIAQRIRDINSVMNEEINTVLQLYLSKRTGLLQEMMGREIWMVSC